MRYKPWGSTRYTSGTTPTTYRRVPPGRGQREEVAVGLYYYGACWYDPALGRFIGCPQGADTIVPEPGDAKAFDRYAYVNNNPLKFNDPTGHCTQGAKGRDDEPECYALADKLAKDFPNDPLAQYGNLWAQDEIQEYYEYLQGLGTDPQAVLEKMLTEVAGMQPIFDENGNIDPRATFEQGIGNVLKQCGQAIGGVCGASWTVMGGAITPVGAKGSVDFYADANGDMAVYATVYGGGYFVPSVADVKVTGVSVAGARGATVDNLSGAGGQFGVSAKLIGGPTVDWIFGRADEGYWHGVSIGGNGGAGVEIHLTVSYSQPLYHSK